MKEIRIFLASSINEFKNERNAIGDLVRRIQDKLNQYEIYIDLFECEFYPNTMAKAGRKQEEYNEYIRTSDLFFMLIGTRAGQFTVEEYEVAKGVPTIEKYVILYGENQDDSVIALKENLKVDNETTVVEAQLEQEIFTTILKGIESKLGNSLKIVEENNKIIIESLNV